MKRVQASTGTLDNIAAAHAIAPIRRMIFICVSPRPKWRAITLTNASSSLAPRPTYHFARLRVCIESLSGFEGVAGGTQRSPFASADRFSPSRPAIAADESQGAESRQKKRPARELWHADLDRKRIGVQAGAPTTNANARGQPEVL